MAKKKLKPADEWYSDGNYKLPTELVQEFYDKVIELAEETFGRDGDRSLPVSIHIVDRTRFEPVHFIEVPYRHKIEDEAKAKLNAFRYEEPTDEQRREIEDEMKVQLDRMLSYLTLNVSMAMERLQTELKIRQYHNVEKEIKKEKK
jgi:hypothetical protein